MWPLAILTSDRINEGFFFYVEIYGGFARPKKLSVMARWPYYRGGRKRDFHCRRYYFWVSVCLSQSSRAGEGVVNKGRHPALFLDQIEVRLAEKIFFWDRRPPLSEGLDPPLETLLTDQSNVTFINLYEPGSHF